MKIIGLTGGIASGKTTILNFIKKQKIPVHDSDVVVVNLYNNSTREFVNFLKIIGLGNCIKQKKINKKKVREEVLNNNEKLEELETFVHKKVKISRDKFIKKNKILKKSIIILDIPLLFEKKLETICDYVLLAYSPEKIRFSRAIKRKNMDENSLKKIMKLQMSDKLKITKSDFVINTSLDKNNSNIQALRAINIIRNTTTV